MTRNVPRCPGCPDQHVKASLRAALPLRSAATAWLACLLTLVALAVLPPLLVWAGGVVLGVCLVHHLGPARSDPTRSPDIRAGGL